MSDESRLQVVRKGGQLSPAVSLQQSSLVARGRRESVALLARASKLVLDNRLARIRQLAEEGDAHSQWALVDAYSRGEGVPQDDDEAMYWYQKTGWDWDEYTLGLKYYDGVHLPKDYAQAAKWLTKGTLGPCETFGFGEIHIAKCYFMLQDYGEAAQWLLESLHYGDDNGEASSMLTFIYGLCLTRPRADRVRIERWRLPQSTYASDVEEANAFLTGLAYAYGRGVGQDDCKAANYFERGAENGDIGAQAHLGLAYALGRGVPRNLIKAHFCIVMAINSIATNPDENRRHANLLPGLESASANLSSILKIIVADMSSQQIATSEALLREQLVARSSGILSAWGAFRAALAELVKNYPAQLQEPSETMVVIDCPIGRDVFDGFSTLVLTFRAQVNISEFLIDCTIEKWKHRSSSPIPPSGALSCVSWSARVSERRMHFILASDNSSFGSGMTPYKAAETLLKDILA